MSLVRNMEKRPEALTSESPLPQREQTPVFCARSKCGAIELPILHERVRSILLAEYGEIIIFR